MNFKKIFNCDIKSVSMPCIGARGYEVTVRYVHHGDETYQFDTDNTALYSLYGGPAAAARAFYNRCMQAVVAQRNKVK